MKKSSIVFLIFSFFYLSAQNDPDNINFRSPPYTDTSVLSDGDIYKIEIQSEGIYKITYDYLKSMGIDIAKVNPKNIKIYGNGGGSLKQLIDDNFIDDLLEIPIYVEGENDNKFDENDYILFYAEGADKWNFSPETKLWEFKKNIYSLTNYYFIKISESTGKRIKNTSLSDTPVYSSNEVDAFAVHEKDRLNLLGHYIKTEGSGQDWYGESISNNSEINFSNSFKDFNFIKDKGIDVKVIFAGRDSKTSKLTITNGDETVERNINSVKTGLYESLYADRETIAYHFVPKLDIIDLKIKYSGTNGWLDKIELNGRKKASFTSSPLVLTDKYAPENSIASLTINNLGTSQFIWDITRLDNISNFTFDNNGTIIYNTSHSTKFITFSKIGQFLTPGKYKKIENQNLHGIADADMLVVYPKEFEDAALTFSEHRADYSDIKVYPIELTKIFNEFSCGKNDPTAIRDFVKMLKVKNPKFNYLLLIGDGSYDARGITTDKDYFIPVYETKKTLDPIFSFPSDDYYGLLSYGEGGNLTGKLDISIGRFPVRTAKQAEIFVQKIINYETDIKYFGDWQNNITLAADDEDSNGHLNGAEKIYFNVSSKYKIANFDKIYLDAFQQENNAGGQRYPDVNRAINSDFFKGHLIFNYVGHGGPKGLAQERILLKDDINSWNNKYKLPLLITATCSFMGFDDPAVNTAGEVAFLKEKGGVIGLFSTVRAVYAHSNDALMRSTYNAFFENDDSKHLPLGDIIRIAKNKTSSDSNRNKRKFLLFGDPSLSLKFPKYNIFTSKVNGKLIQNDSTIIDTLSAMEKVTIEGYISDKNNEIINDFNGKLYITLFDKPEIIKTFANDYNGDESEKTQFVVQKNVLFKGTAEVINGKFIATFILPKDINYQFGQGKISYYAIDNELKQAAGRYNNIIIGGTAKNIIVDNEGPIINLFMNDIGFAYGGITNSEPILLGFLEDESGINISSYSIGHNLSAVMDNFEEKKYVLNDFYKSELNNYKKGSFNYPLSKLEAGRHTIKVEAWDIFNNKSEKIIEFVVVDKSKNNLEQVLNYPNPFTTHTKFRFEHDLPDFDLDIVINIFTMSGKLVKTIKHKALTQGFQVSDIEWDGTDDFGTKLGNGVYVYKIKVFSTEYNIKRESKFEKLVILR